MKKLRMFDRILTRLKIKCAHRFRLKEGYEGDDNITIISSNCVAGTIYHDLNMQFRSPTINCIIYANDYLKFCKNLAHYMNYRLEYAGEVATDGGAYPVAKLDDIYIHAVHYKTYDVFSSDWYKRATRVNYKKIYLIWCDRDGYEECMIDVYAKLPYNKVIFLHKPVSLSKYPFAIQIPECEEENQVPTLTDYVDFHGTRYYEMNFDVLCWLKTGIVKRKK